jgi:hypothetical protein
LVADCVTIGGEITAFPNGGEPELAAQLKEARSCGVAVQARESGADYECAVLVEGRGWTNGEVGIAGRCE